MEDQFIDLPGRAEIELHPVALELVDDKGSALVGVGVVGVGYQLSASADHHCLARQQQLWLDGSSRLADNLVQKHVANPVYLRCQIVGAPLISVQVLY